MFIPHQRVVLRRFVLRAAAPPSVPAQGSRRTATPEETRGEFLTTAQAACLLGLRPKTLRNKVADRIFIAGIHFVRRRGLGPRWKRSELLRWLETNDAVVD